jgi:hypothetical protein
VRCPLVGQGLSQPGQAAFGSGVGRH